MTKYRQSSKLNNVLYDIRGPILEEANRMEAMGHRILKLNIGNTAPFGFEAPDAIMMDIIRHLPVTQGYSDSRGLYSARTAIVQHYQNRGILDLEPNDVYLGNGVSELIPMTLQALCETDDEILVPMPDYPLWTASVALSGGKPVHYLCDEENNWYPDLEDIKSKITSRTKGIVVINPNNPTGSVYPHHILQQIVDVAREHELVVFTDEIYEHLTYDGVNSVSILKVVPELTPNCIILNGVAKTYAMTGWRVGWMVGPQDVIAAASNLQSHLSSNVNNIAQRAALAALTGPQDEVAVMHAAFDRRRKAIVAGLNAIEGVHCPTPQGAFYAYPDVRGLLGKEFDGVRPQTSAELADLILEKALVAVVPGEAFGPSGYLRLSYALSDEDLAEGVERLQKFLGSAR